MVFGLIGLDERRHEVLFQARLSEVGALWHIQLARAFCNDRRNLVILARRAAFCLYSVYEHIFDLPMLCKQTLNVAGLHEVAVAPDTAVFLWGGGRMKASTLKPPG